MLFVLCIVVNIFAIASFVKNKWRVVAFVYSLALLLLTSMMLFNVDIPETQSFLRYIFGETVYTSIADFLNEYSSDALAPYLAVEVISILYTIVATIKAAEKLISYIYKKKKDLFRISNRLDKSFVFSSFIAIKQPKKRYLLNCTLLC